MSSRTVTVTVNGENRVVERGATVGGLVDSLDRGRAGFAVAVNGEVVPRSRWDVAEVGAGDAIEILTAAQGG